MTEERETLIAVGALIRRVLDDSESRPGGWGPDVTCVAYLEEALALIESALTSKPNQGINGA